MMPTHMSVPPPVLVGRDHPQPIPHVVLLQVLLSEVLEVPAGGAPHAVQDLLVASNLTAAVIYSRSQVHDVDVAPLGELRLCDHRDLGLVLGDLDVVTQDAYRVASQSASISIVSHV
jgi:hypothetical protein